MQADSVSVDPVTGIQTKQLTGERLNAAAPNAHYVWNEQQGAYVDTTGTHSAGHATLAATDPNEGRRYPAIQTGRRCDGRLFHEPARRGHAGSGPGAGHRNGHGRGETTTTP